MFRPGFLLRIHTVNIYTFVPASLGRYIFFLQSFLQRFIPLCICGYGLPHTSIGYYFYITRSIFNYGKFVTSEEDKLQKKMQHRINDGNGWSYGQNKNKSNRLNCEIGSLTKRIEKQKKAKREQNENKKSESEAEKKKLPCIARIGLLRIHQRQPPAALLPLEPRLVQGRLAWNKCSSRKLWVVTVDFRVHTHTCIHTYIHSFLRSFIPMFIQGRSCYRLTGWFPVALVAYKILTTHSQWRRHQWFGRQVILQANTHAGSPPLGRQGGGQPGCHRLRPSCSVHPLLNRFMGCSRQGCRRQAL